MRMDLEFKEKTYEKYFYGELCRQTQICYSPDQCDEHFLGFDDAFFLPKEFLGGAASLPSTIQMGAAHRH